jgi:hypothetical protein
MYIKAQEIYFEIIIYPNVEVVSLKIMGRRLYLQQDTSVDGK